MQEKFSISHKNQEIGSFSKSEIIAKVKAGELSALDFVFVNEKNDWVPLLEFLPSDAMAPADAKPTSALPPKAPPRPPVAPAHAPPPKSPPPQLVAPKVPPPRVAATNPSVKVEASDIRPVPGEKKRGKISLKGGVGQIELMHYAAGTLKLALLDEEKRGLSLDKPHELVVKADQATKFVIHAPKEAVAGQETTLTIEAQDKWGNRDTEYSGSIAAVLSNGSDLGQSQFNSGKATMTFTATKAEVVSVRLVDSAKTGLDISATCEVNYVAGPAAKLVISTPEASVAGQPVRVEVRAVDQYGNLATTCNDDIDLEVSSEELKTALEATRKAS